MDTDNQPNEEMYDHFLRNTTNRLQDDLRSEMRTYNYEKERLVHHLSHLHPSPSSPASNSAQSSMDQSGGAQSSIDQSGRSSSTQRKHHKFYKAPSMVTHNLSSDGTASEASSSTFSSPEQKWKERKDLGERMKKERDLFKLPVIHSASLKRSEWDTGNYSQTIKPRMTSDVEPLPGIQAARAFLSETMKIPAIHDPHRTDKVFNSKSKKEFKKVTFADENHKTLLSFNRMDTSEDMDNPNHDSKNYKRKGLVPKLNPTDPSDEVKITRHDPKNFKRKGPVSRLNLTSKRSRPMGPQRMSVLPQLNITASEVRANPQRITEGVNEWKSLYSKIIHPEHKIQALSDIMLAVLLKKRENELAMKYGDGPRPSQRDAEGHTLPHSGAASHTIQYRDEGGHIYTKGIPMHRSSPRLGVGFPNTTQLQHYLRQMSRSRQALDKLYPHGNYGHSEHSATPVSVRA